MRTRYLLLLSFLVLTLSACGPTPSAEIAPGGPDEPATAEAVPPEQAASPLPEPEPEPGAPARPGESPLPQPGLSPISPLPAPATPALAAATRFLADQLSISPEEITVISSEPVEWPDTSLGCPQPGVMYAQVLTPGYRFRLEAAGAEYEVHTDQAGQSVVTCEPASSGLNDDPQAAPQAAFRALLAHLTGTFPGFGLDQQREWAYQDISKEAVVGVSTWAWRGGEWTLEMTFPAVPEPAYESVLFHQQAGTVWRGTLEPGGRVSSTGAPVVSSLAFEVGACDESVPPENLDEWAEVEIAGENGAIHIDQKVSYVCCAELVLSAGQDGDVIRVIETNAGQVCRCTCGYPVRAKLTGLPAGTYTVEIWGIQHHDLHPLQLLASTQITLS